MLTAFAPIMTKKAKKSSDPNCIGGVKKMLSIFPVAGKFNFTAPEEIIGEATITLVGAGGKGGDGFVTLGEIDGKQTITGWATGGGGGAGGFIKQSVALTAGSPYEVIVGKGGGKDTTVTNGNGGDTSFGTSFDTIVTAQGGMAGVKSNADQAHGEGGMGGITTSNSGESEGAENVAENGYDGAQGNNGAGGAGGTNHTGNFASVGGGVCLYSNCFTHGAYGSDYEKNNASPVGFVAGFGGAGGGVNGITKTAGYGGTGGDGYAQIEYKVRCN